MKVKLLVALFLLTYQFSFSQTEGLLQGKVLNQNHTLQDVDVINFNTKEHTRSDQFGNFSIAAKTNDLLIFISKDYELKKLLVNDKLYDKKGLSVFLNLKPEELQEVLITKMPSIKLSKDKKYELSKLNEYALENSAKTLKIPHVNDGIIQYGMNFLNIAGMIANLFVKEKEPKKEPPPEIEFGTLAKNTCDQKFFTENLKLERDEIDLFLQFCDADSKSKKLKENPNLLSMMDFLTIKNIEFQKLNEVVK